MPNLINGASTENGFTKASEFSGQGSWKGAIVVRASNNFVAQTLARAMSTIHNNPNIKYSRSQRDSIYTAGINARGTTYADCSSAVSMCVRLATGNKTFNTATGNGQSMANALMATGFFMDSFNFVSNEATPLCAGDIVIYRNGGHTAIVMDGTARTGADWELYSGSDDYMRGFEMDWSAFGGEDFEPRLEEPTIEPEEEYLPEELIEAILAGEVIKEELEEEYDMYYIYEGRGGYSPFGEVPLTNKTYAWNRFAEILGCQESCPLTKGDPGSWMVNDGDGFVRDMAPELGAAMCFSNLNGGEGFACIVEFMLEGEVLVTSQVVDGHFTLEERTKRYGMWDFDNYMFTGFIHNPGAYMGAEDESALETFLRIAEEQVGSNQSWTYQQTGITSVRGWSAAFIVACSSRAGSSLNIVIPNVDSVSTIGRVGVLRGMGRWHKGAIYDGGYEPSAGDIVIFRYKHKGTESIYMGDQAAIVTESDGGTFTAIMGDDGGRVTQKDYGVHSPFIAGYFSPKWEQVDGTTASKKEYRNIQGLYTNGVTKYDACARTVCYANRELKPSISPSKVKLAAVNYTGLLANFYSVFGQASTSTASNAELVVDFWTNTIRSYYQMYPEDFNPVSGAVADLSGFIAAGVASSSEGSGWYGNVTESANVSVTATVQQVYDFFQAKGLNSAAITGILANIQAESGFRTGAIGDKGTSAGLVQWHASRMKGMQAYVGANWASNVTGQLEYIWKELNTSSYSSVLSTLKNVPNTADGARQATAKWIRSYEVPQGYDNPESQVYKTRLAYANGFFSQVGG